MTKSDFLEHEESRISRAERRRRCRTAVVTAHPSLRHERERSILAAEMSGGKMEANRFGLHANLYMNYV